MSRRLTLCFDGDQVHWDVQDNVTGDPPCQLTVDIDELTKDQLLHMLDQFRDWTLATLILDAADQHQVVMD